MIRKSGAASAAPQPFPDPFPSNSPATAPGFLMWRPDMTNCETNPIPALDFAAWDGKERDFRSRLIKTVVVNTWIHANLRWIERQV
jgi:hypothetical protein